MCILIVLTTLDSVLFLLINRIPHYYISSLKDILTKIELFAKNPAGVDSSVLLLCCVVAFVVVSFCFSFCFLFVLLFVCLFLAKNPLPRVRNTLVGGGCLLFVEFTLLLFCFVCFFCFLLYYHFFTHSHTYQLARLARL